MTFWEWERLFLQGLFVCFFWLILKTLNNLLRESQSDRRARETAIQELRRTVAALAEKTEIDAMVVKSSSDQNLLQVAESLHQAIAENTKKTEEATAAAHEAFREANGVNQKILDVNTRMEKDKSK